MQLVATMGRTGRVLFRSVSHLYLLPSHLFFNCCLPDLPGEASPNDQPTAGTLISFESVLRTLSRGSPVFSDLSPPSVYASVPSAKSGKADTTGNITRARALMKAIA